MADAENSEFEESENTEEQQSQKKGFSVSPFLVRILGIVAAVIGIIVLVVVVVIIMFKIMTPTGGAGIPNQDVGIKSIKREHHEFLKIDEAFRQQLIDGKMIQVKIALGYKAGDKKTQQELSQIIPEIRDIVIKHLGRLKGEYFNDENALDHLEEDLMKQINRVLNSGKVEKIYFQEYTLM